MGIIICVELLIRAMVMNTRCLWALLLACGGAVVAHAEESSPFAGLKYRNIGPAAGGRTTRVAGIPGDPLTYYVASASGGVWKSDDGGINFKPIFDDQSTSSIGSLAVAPSDHNVIYIGAGEANIRGNVCAGNGIYKSVDAGKTWKHVWKQIGQIGTMAVHPKNADIAFAAVLGHAFGPNAERGVYRTKDGGQTWERVLFKDDDTGASDVAIDPHNPRVIYAGLWTARRQPWDLVSGGPGSGLYVSRDGGDTWTRLGPDAPPKKKKANQPEPPETGLPKGPWGKVCVAVAPSDSNRVYAMIEADKGGLFRSDDGGESWQLASDDRRLRQRAWYFSTITVHPTQPDVVYCPQVPLLKSIDGGKSFKEIRGISHSDHHDLWIDPKNPKRMIDAHDGGVDITVDGGKAWRAPPLMLGQFYHIACDNAFPYRVLGCMQDLGTASGPSRSPHRAGILLSDWHTVGGGEAGFAVPDPTDPNIVYAGEYSGYISRYDHRTRQSRHVGVYPYTQSGHGAEDLKYRFQWTSPILISKHDPKNVYHAANVLFKSTNGGQSWEKQSNDLTRNDKNKQKWAGGPITGDNTGVEVYGTIFALAESPLNKKIMWVGSDDGLVHISTDQCGSWKNVTPNVPGLPDWATILCIEPSPHDEGTAYLVAEAHRLDNYKPYVWRTKDYGETWTLIIDGIPNDEYARVLRADPKKKGLLYLGTERGVRYSTDDGETWESLKLNMPTVPVTDMVVKGDDLVLGTQGRSIWILDDITPVRAWTPMIENKAAHLFPTPPAVRWHQGSAYGDLAPGDNPATGAVFTYALKSAAQKPIVIEILDEKNSRVAKIEGQPKKSAMDDDDDGDEPTKAKIPGEEGVNRFVWDLTHQGPDLIPKAQNDYGNPKRGPVLAPGMYTVKMTIDGRTLTGKFEVQIDPRVTEPRGIATLKTIPQKITVMPRLATPDEIARLEKAPWILRRGALDLIRDEVKEQEAFTLKVRDAISSVSAIVQDIRAIQKQLKLQEDLLAKDPKAKAYLKSVKGVGLKLEALEAKLHNPKAKVSYDILAQKGGAKLYSQLTGLYHAANEGDGPPTQGQRQLAEEFEKELADYGAEFATLKSDDLAKLNELARKQNVPMIWIPTPPKK